VPLKRFYNLELKYLKVSARIAKIRNKAELAALRQNRLRMVAEAREIVNKLNIPAPI
jgi:hypothetical protein